MRIKIIRVFFIIGCLGFFQCQEDKFSFYKDPMQAHDVWRLPLIEPHQLITAYCCEGWNFQEKEFSKSFSADSINLDNNYVLFWSGAENYGLLDIKRKTVSQFGTYQQFADSVKLKGITKKLYCTKTVYANWRETGQLPWAEEILTAQVFD
ncbi:hypothetical protein [Hymenobacter lucidus]|uniref:Uncharacterized protein n=1 Tax=Hymenobacter lucidus TaxID=2880930 RepID=A0ABS8AUS9_9BACT|nr:hypothetical protein [Hymenobacter lucidus]MCB2409987.1 hypothetical protein [Hymenobacter lucidus]